MSHVEARVVFSEVEFAACRLVDVPRHDRVDEMRAELHEGIESGTPRVSRQCKIVNASRQERDDSVAERDP